MAHRRSGARGVASFVMAAATTVAVTGSGACVQTGASLGQACLKDDDCFSGHCAAQRCVSSAPELSPDASRGDSTVADAPGSVEGSTTDDGPSGSSDAGAGDAVPGDAPAAGDADAASSYDATDGPSTFDAQDGSGSPGADTG